MRTIYFVTTNSYKFSFFMKAVKIDGVRVKRLGLETPEIQASTCTEVAKFSAKWAAEKTGKPVVKEDVGIFLNGVGGFPGPYTKHFEDCCGADGMLKLLEGKRDRSAYWEYSIAYCKPGKEPVAFTAKQPGRIAKKKRGQKGHEADKVFVPEHHDKTISQLFDGACRGKALGTFEMVQKSGYKRDESHYKRLKKYLEGVYA